VHAEDALVAVAASFIPPMQALIAEFESRSAHTITLASGSTGGLYAQIVNGAPFDVFVAADAERPRLLEESGAGLAGTRATVALGKLVLLAREPALIENRGLDALRSDAVRRVAIANPRVAPYGLAAQQTLESMGLWDTLTPRIVRGESVAQTYAMVATGNADLGFVALALVLASDTNASFVAVPDSLYAPIHQDMIVLARALGNEAAHGLREFLLSETAREIIRRYGYAVPDP